MIYLKKFENKLWDVDDTNVTTLKHNLPNIDTVALKELSKILHDNNLDYHSSSKKIQIFLDDGFFIKFDTLLYMNKRIKISSIKIIDLSDEWYQVSFLQMNDISTVMNTVAKYKCDGREGVIDLLRNKRVIK